MRLAAAALRQRRRNVLNDGKMDEIKRSLQDAFVALDKRRAELDQTIENGNTKAASQLIHECQKLASRIDQLRAKAKR